MSEGKGKAPQARQKLPVKRKAAAAPSKEAAPQKKRERAPRGVGMYTSETSGNTYIKIPAQKRGYWVKKTSSITQESTNLGSSSTISSRPPPISVARSTRSKTLGLTKR